MAQTLTHSNSVPASSVPPAVSTPAAAHEPVQPALKTVLKAVNSIAITVIYLTLLGYVLLGLPTWNNPSITS